MVQNDLPRGRRRLLHILCFGGRLVVSAAAGAGHVDLVFWCLDNGWEYTDGVMEAAAKEGRWNVIKALVGRGFSCLVHVEIEKTAPSHEAWGVEFPVSWMLCIDH